MIKRLLRFFRTHLCVEAFSMAVNGGFYMMTLFNFNPNAHFEKALPKAIKYTVRTNRVLCLDGHFYVPVRESLFTEEHACILARQTPLIQTIVETRGAQQVASDFLVTEGKNVFVRASSVTGTGLEIAEASILRVGSRAFVREGGLLAAERAIATIPAERFALIGFRGVGSAMFYGALEGLFGIYCVFAMLEATQTVGDSRTVTP